VKTATKVLIGVGAASCSDDRGRLADEQAEGEGRARLHGQGREAYARQRGLGDGLLQPKTKVNVQSMVIGEIVKLPVKEGGPRRARGICSCRSTRSAIAPRSTASRRCCA
jgi:hypothetical protein